MERSFLDEGLSARVRFTGVLTGGDLADAYKAMDIFRLFFAFGNPGARAGGGHGIGHAGRRARCAGRRAKSCAIGVNGRLLAADASPGEFAQALPA
jgi:hypothetical protein